MPDVTLVVLCAGNSSRFNHKVKKQWLRIDNEPLWLYVSNRLKSFYNFKQIIITSHIDEFSYMQNFSNEFSFVTGGETRQESMKNALQKVTTPYVMVTDVARACIPQEIIKILIENKDKASCIVPALNVSDTVIYDEKVIQREKVKLIQTPQLSHTKALKEALETKIEYTDDSTAIKANGGSIFYIEGSKESEKLTFLDNLSQMKSLKAPNQSFFTGFGIDIHEFQNDKTLYLGGVKFDTSYGFKAHSDGDVLIHSVIDALLGAAGAGDIGDFFPDSDLKYKNADSKELLIFIVNFINNVGYQIVNIDLTIIAEQPKITPLKQKIRYKMAELLQIEAQFVNIKATTSEKMGYIGRKEGVAVQSCATLKYQDWTK